MKLALLCSAGGHLTEMLQIENAYKKHDHFFVTFEREDSKALSGRVYFVNDPKRNPFKVLKNVFQSFALLVRERPEVVITTGAGMAVPFCYLAKLFGKKVVYIESFCRIEQPSLTGKMLYGIADLFLVQWEDLLEKYGKKACYWGKLL